MKRWTCDKCRVVVEDNKLPIGWMLNLFEGVHPLCRMCQPMSSKDADKDGGNGR